MASKRAQRRRAERTGHLSKFLHAQHACANKERFLTEAAAATALESLTNCRYFDGGNMNVYLCPTSKDHWHVGHIPAKVARRG